ncbi:MAG TPA: hypothetical protein VK828_01520 [Terriglobales bacterium]|jgi:hypothetical protein|nr:hypothetical protein [Terriglobales bacterium]
MKTPTGIAFTAYLLAYLQAFPTSILDHQYNSFDELREHRYARAHHEIRRPEAAGARGVLFVSFTGPNTKIQETRKYSDREVDTSEAPVSFADRMPPSHFAMTQAL